jgi:SH3-like domain-containing protein
MLLSLAGCTTTAPQEPPAAPVAVRVPPAVLQPTTVVPENFARELSGPTSALVVPAQMLRTSAIARPRAEVRSGPGAQFDIEEFVLEQGTTVILFDKIGVWQKVLAIGSWKKGWVHQATLAAPEPREGAVTLDAQLLPTVMATHSIDAVKRYPDGAPVKVRIPTGAMFRSLSFDGAAALVVLPETNSVMWVSRKDVQ